MPTFLQHLITTRQGQLSRRQVAREAHVSPDLLADIAHGIPRACRISTLIKLATWLNIHPLDMTRLYLEHYKWCQGLKQPFSSSDASKTHGELNDYDCPLT